MVLVTNKFVYITIWVYSACLKYQTPRTFQFLFLSEIIQEIFKNVHALLLLCKLYVQISHIVHSPTLIITIY